MVDTRHGWMGRPVRSRVCEIRVFTTLLRTLWWVVFAFTVTSEVIPAPAVHPVLFYSFLAFRVLLFLALGFITPVAFWRYNSIGLGLLFSVAGAFGCELLQSVSPGHTASVREFAVKCGLLLAGFVMALVARHDKQIDIGFVKIELQDRSQPSVH